MSQHPIHYSSPTKLLHWLTAIVVIIAFATGLGGSEVHVYASTRDFDRYLHETLGIIVLALTALRLLWRFFDKHPEPEPSTPVMKIAAQAAQFTLYLLLFAVPLTAIAGAWFEGHSVTLLGGIEIVSQLPMNHSLGATIAEIHTLLGDAILWIAGLHALAALYHHIILKDRVLKAMLPAKLAEKI